MQTIITFFQDIPSSYRTALLVGGLLLLWSVEGVMPLARMHYKKYSHAALNLFFHLTTIIINFSFALLIIKASQWAENNQFGLLNWVKIPTWAAMIVGVMFLDFFGAYFVHWCEHRIKWMWRFHIIHHTDTYIDATSALRHHPGESIFRAVFTTTAVILAGAPMWLVMLYQTLSALLSQFNHANISLPKRLDAALSYVIVSPNMHKVHHHFSLPQTDTNFGNIFSIWDRIFGTYMHTDPSQIIYGLDTHPTYPEHSNIGTMLKIPFQAYRNPVGAKFGVPKTTPK